MLALVQIMTWPRMSNYPIQRYLIYWRIFWSLGINELTLETFTVLVMVVVNIRSWSTGLLLGLHLANERRRYKVTPSLIGWAQTYNQPWGLIVNTMAL